MTDEAWVRSRAPKIAVQMFTDRKQVGTKTYQDVSRFVFFQVSFPVSFSPVPSFEPGAPPLLDEQLAPEWPLLRRKLKK